MTLPSSVNWAYSGPKTARPFVCTPYSPISVILDGVTVESANSWQSWSMVSIEGVIPEESSVWNKIEL